jgi:hypothetical protein
MPAISCGARRAAAGDRSLAGFGTRNWSLGELVRVAVAVIIMVATYTSLSVLGVRDCTRYAKRGVRDSRSLRRFNMDLLL